MTNISGKLLKIRKVCKKKREVKLNFLCFMFYVQHVQIDKH